MAFVTIAACNFFSNRSTLKRANRNHKYLTSLRPPHRRMTVSMSEMNQANASNDAIAGVKAPDSMVNAAHAAADAAGALIRGYFRGGELATRLKNDASPVTAADTAAEAAMRTILEEAFPGHAVMGEESGGAAVETLATAEWSWCLDPIGTVVS